MKTYTILPCSKAAQWSDVPALEMDYDLIPMEHSVTASAQLRYDENALYVRLTAKETNIRAEHTGPLDEICEDSCLEFFFCPIEGDKRYFNLEVNPNGAIYFGFGSNVENLQRIVQENTGVTPVTARTDDGWSVEYAISHDFVRLFFPDYNPAPGKAIRANCYKCADLSDHPHWLCWNFVPRELDTFHCPDHYGIMYFA